MRFKPVLFALLAASLLLPSLASAEPMAPECRRFKSEKARPTDFAPRLARLCVRLIDSFHSPDGLDTEEREAATRLGTFLAIVGELDLRKGALGFGHLAPSARPTNETARYLIADRIGLLDIADRLAPQPKVSAALH